MRRRAPKSVNRSSPRGRGATVPRIDGGEQVRVRLPLGVRDYLPDAAALRLGFVRESLETFARWGYRQIVTPVFEYADVLGKGSDTPAIRFVEPTTGEVAALRPDITPQVARLVATRFGDRPGPIRLSYEGSVLRLAHRLGERELHQVGVELIDAPQPEGDAEVMALASETLTQAGIGELTLDIGHMGLLREALRGLGEPIREAIARKDALQTERLARVECSDAAQRKLVAALPRLHGDRDDVLRRARKLATGAARAALQELEAALDALAVLSPGTEVALDLGEVRGFGYYTGVRFAGFAAGHGDALFHGGRYDDLCARYGRAARATGFAIEVDAVAGLLESVIPAEIAEGGILVGGNRALAPLVARTLREQGACAAVCFECEGKSAERTLLESAATWGFERTLLVGTRDATWLELSPSGVRSRWPLDVILGRKAKSSRRAANARRRPNRTK